MPGCTDGRIAKVRKTGNRGNRNGLGCPTNGACRVTRAPAAASCRAGPGRVRDLMNRRVLICYAKYAQKGRECTTALWPSARYSTKIKTRCLGTGLGRSKHLRTSVKKRSGQARIWRLCPAKALGDRSRKRTGTDELAQGRERTRLSGSVN